jgi:hypothetical protein
MGDSELVRSELELSRSEPIFDDDDEGDDPEDSISTARSSPVCSPVCSRLR